jgi:hypothetical protein
VSDYLNSTRRSIAWLKQAHDAGQLEIKPPFQRNPVWTESQKSYLIDSILRGYPIPELYMQESVNENGEEEHVIVDGQQRVRACLEFIEGKYALEPLEAPTWPDAKFEDLTAEERKRIYAYNFIVRQLPPVPDEELRVVFRRLNRNTVVLSAQELRHATYWGEFITSMEALADLDWWSSSGIFTANDVRRMIDIEYVSELVVAFLHGPQNKKSSLEKWYPAYEKEFPDKKRVHTTFTTILGELSHLVPNIAGTRWRKKSDFYTLFLVLAAHSKDFPLSKGGREKVAARIKQFGENVSSFIAETSTGNAHVKKYADAVQRAASDLANRRARSEALESALKGTW